MFTSINGHGLCSTANFAKISDTHLATCSYRSSIEAPTSKSSACGSSFSLSSQRILNIHHQRCSQRLVARRGIKWIENFETQLDIPEDRRKALEEFLQNETFCSQACNILSVLVLAVMIPYYTCPQCQCPLRDAVLSWSSTSYHQG